MSKIVAFHKDQHGDWVADLDCGHTMHVRHNPPYQERAWVLTPEGRAKFLGFAVECKLCAAEKSDAGTGDA